MLKLKMKKGAVTGGLSCGKSSVCQFFKELGAYVVSADDIVHQLLTPHTNLGQKIIQLLGNEIVVKGQIDRSIIASKVFNHPSLLKSLEALLHPAVYEEIEKQYQEIKKEKKVPLFIAEIPLLFETCSKPNFDFIIAVIADPEVCEQRFIKTTGYDHIEFQKRSSRQLSNSEKARRSDFVIFNNGSLEQMRTEAADIYNNLINH